MHHFMGHHAGRVLPLYRDATGLVPNVAPGLDYMGDRLAISTTAEDLLAYVASIVARPSYTELPKELEVPGVRVPLTADPQTWSEAVQPGREVLWLHTYGERYIDAAAGRPLKRPRLPCNL
jgi:hypothetical protein